MRGFFLLITYTRPRLRITRLLRSLDFNVFSEFVTFIALTYTSSKNYVRTIVADARACQAILLKTAIAEKFYFTIDFKSQDYQTNSLGILFYA